MGKVIKKDMDHDFSRSYNWATVVYPESCPDNFVELIKEVSCAWYAISPLHDSDVCEDGSPKKPHYHVLFHFPTTKSSSQFSDIILPFCGVGREAVKNWIGYFRYLVHADDPDKFQYDYNDINSNKSDFIKLFEHRDPVDSTTLYAHLIDFIIENKPRDYSELILMLLGEDLDLLKSAKNNSYSINMFLKNYRKHLVSFRDKDEEFHPIEKFSQIELTFSDL